jgi:hypothetical protein
MTTTHTDLEELGDALERAAAATIRRFPRPSRRVALAVAVTALVVPAATIAGVALTSGSDVAQTLEPGAAIFEGTKPTCTVVTPNVEYHCVLASAPAPEVADFKGTVEPTVDATKHVNGGCRSLASDGMTWQCYLGEEAVRQQIVGEDLLGVYAPSPGHG